GSLGIRLTWDADVYPYCWLWQELGGTQGEPWRGQARVIGIEPAASWPGQGLARVAASTGTALRIGPGATVAGEVALTVCVGAGQTTAVAGDVALTVRAGAGQTTEGPR
ncbi:MAG: hypothetical protein LBS56_05065, partial [Propionibacteriaceae bacterium]|nr:hypothetical protein [Propionibacteriaceae bacterium]